MVNKLLYKRVDNSPLIVFRVLFGLCITAEIFSLLASGFVRRIFVEPQFTFNFIGLDFLQPLPGNGMYFYFFLMGILSICITIGFKYRMSAWLSLLLWLGVYLMQKTAYNNYHYLVILVLFFLAISPAHRYKSVDAVLNPKIKSHHMPNWVLILFIAQVWIMYTFAAIAKLYPDWLDGTVPRIILSYASDYFGGIEWFSHTFVIHFFGYMGIIFDLFFIPFLLWKKTRWIAFVASLFFHFFNGFFFSVGTFPFVSISFALFFFSKSLVHKTFLPHKTFYKSFEIKKPKHHAWLTGFIIFFIGIQLVMPLRHWCIKGDVLWTEEGHRHSWRLMTRFRNAKTSFKVYDKITHDTINVNHLDYLTTYQESFLSKPDGIWQFSKHLKNEYHKKGKEVSIFVDSKVSLNGKAYLPLVDKKYDMAQAKWNYFFHNDWIILYE